jgi:peptidoglycan/LPS O-acetylase OafA/YrhL
MSDTTNLYTDSSLASPGATPAPVIVVPRADRSQQAEPLQGRGGENIKEGRPAPLAEKPRNTRYQSLDLWRGAACLMLLVYHATFYADLTFHIGDTSSWSLAGVPLYLIRKCWVGVPIFFVISGYCIAASIDSLRRRDHSLWDYFVRRVRRIYPPLWIMCVITVAFTALMQRVPDVAQHCEQLPRLSEFSVWQWFGNFAAAETWRHNVVGGKPTYLMPNTWTLCYEEQFYLVTGLLLAFASRQFFRMSALVTLGVLGLKHVLRTLGVPQVGFFWDGHWIMFATGILTYHALMYQTSRQRVMTWILLIAGMVYGVVDRILAADPVQKHLAEYVFVSCLFGIVLVILKRWDQAMVRNWVALPFVWCGKISYSIYLTHFPLVVVVSSLMALWGLKSELAVATIVVPFCVALSLPVAWLFHLAVERRFMNAPAK